MERLYFCRSAATQDQRSCSQAKRRIRWIAVPWYTLSMQVYEGVKLPQLSELFACGDPTNKRPHFLIQP